MFSIRNRALSWAITSFGNEFCLKMRSRLIKALDNRFYVKLMQLEIGLLDPMCSNKTSLLLVMTILMLRKSVKLDVIGMRSCLASLL